MKTRTNTTDDIQQEGTLTELLVHKMQAKEFFYSLMTEDTNGSILSICFNLMQNQALQKSPTGEAYYARQRMAVLSRGH